MAVDGGTESTRVGIFDFQGRLVSQASRCYKTTFARSGWAEQNPEDWWTSLIAAARTAVNAGSVPADQIAAICTDATTCTLVAVDRSGRHLRPALLWMDVRAADQARRIFETGHPALCYSTSGLNAEWMLPKVLWLKENEPQVFARTATFLEYQDWLTYRLTGRLVLNRCTSTHRWFYNTRGWRNPGSPTVQHESIPGPWPTDLWRTLDLEDLAGKVPEEVLPAAGPVGSLTAGAAEDFGLSPSTPVFQGAGDAFAALPGLGVTEPGAIALIAGSSNVVAGYTDREVHGPGILGAFPDVLIPGLWLMEGGQASTGSILAWFKRNFALDLSENTAYEHLSAEAAKIPPGSGGLVAVDSLQGNRTPYSDSMARGAVWGLSLNTSRAQLFRSLIEGIAYGTRHVLETMAGMGMRFDGIRACGGATKSDLYMQIMTDVCGIPISLTEVPEASLLGCAALAAVGLGIYADLSTASREMVRVSRTFEPDREAHQIYRLYFELYKETYPRLRKLMHQMARHLGDTAAPK